jgi:hypothetical protein
MCFRRISKLPSKAISVEFKSLFSYDDPSPSPVSSPEHQSYISVYQSSINESHRPNVYEGLSEVYILYFLLEAAFNIN